MKFLPRFLHPFGERRRSAKETANQATGRKGEGAAALYLRRKKGYRVVACNWRWEKDEIDLVCWDREVLVFVEVKTRTAGGLVPGYFAVDKEKKRVLRRVFGNYLKQLRRKPVTFRFDIVEVSVAEGAEADVLHFQNIPLFPKNYNWGRR